MIGAGKSTLPIDVHQNGPNFVTWQGDGCEVRHISSQDEAASCCHIFCEQ